MNGSLTSNSDIQIAHDSAKPDVQSFTDFHHVRVLGCDFNPQHLPAPCLFCLKMDPKEHGMAWVKLPSAKWMHIESYRYT